jgi:hypothetical protein
MPILLDLASKSISLYKAEADYQSSLFMSGQATPYMTGVCDDDVITLGSNSMITISDKDAKLGFL